MANVTAFVLSDSIAGAADGVTIPGVPGIWTHDRPVLPAAIGYTLAELREAVEVANLPLQEVSVSEKKAFDFFPDPPNRLASSREVAGAAVVTEQDKLAAEIAAAPDASVLDETVEQAVEEG
jgi:hypothetical protein